MSEAPRPTELIPAFILSRLVALRGSGETFQPGEVAGSISTAAMDGPVLGEASLRIHQFWAKVRGKRSRPGGRRRQLGPSHQGFYKACFINTKVCGRQGERRSDWCNRYSELEQLPGQTSNWCRP